MGSMNGGLGKNRAREGRYGEKAGRGCDFTRAFSSIRRAKFRREEPKIRRGDPLNEEWRMQNAERGRRGAWRRGPKAEGPRDRRKAEGRDPKVPKADRGPESGWSVRVPTRRDFASLNSVGLSGEIRRPKERGTEGRPKAEIRRPETMLAAKENKEGKSQTRAE